MQIEFCRLKRGECFKDICGLIEDDKTWKTCDDRIRMVSVDEQEVMI